MTATTDVKKAKKEQERNEAPRERTEEYIPLALQKKLTAEAKPGHRRRWINDEEGRVQMCSRAGWKFVEDVDQVTRDRRATDTSEFGTVIRMVVNRARDARCIYAYLMEIKNELYDAEFLRKQKLIDEDEAGIRDIYANPYSGMRL